MLTRYNCLQETEIEHLVLGLNPMQESARDHLFRCDRCRERFLALSAIYKPMLANDAVADLYETRIILYPLKGQNGTSPVYRLAAQGGQPDESPTVLSFNDQEHNFIGRVLSDPVSGHVVFYLLADDMERTQGIQITLPEANLSGVTNAQGFIDFGVQKNFSCNQVRIILPLAVIILKPINTHAATNREQHLFTLKNLAESDIEITITREIAQGQYLLSFRHIDGQPTLRELKVVAISDLRTLETATEHGVAILQTEALERLLKIHIY